VLTASFKALEQTLSFDVNGGDASSKPADMKVKTDASVDITKISVPTRTGYSFKHWYVKGDAAKTAVGASMTMPAKAVTLVAEWEANAYSIKFDANGGDASVPLADLAATYDADVVLSANTFTRDGYLFKGWALKADTTSAAYQDKASVKNLSSAKDGQVTLYAVWAKDFTAIEAKDSTIYVGDSWTAADNFVSAADQDGKTVDFKDVTVAGTVDTTQAGDYVITYSYGGQSASAAVKVLANQSSVEVKDTELYEGENWNAKDNFVSATDKTGAALKLDKVTVTDAEKVDSTKVGVYEVIYTNGSLSKTAKVTVKPDQREVQVQHTTLTIGDEWHPKHNFVSAKDHDGNDLALEDLEIEGSVDTMKLGVHKVTYKYSKAAKKKLKDTRAVPEKGIAVAEITVVEKAADGDKTPPISGDKGNPTDNGNSNANDKSAGSNKPSGNNNSNNTSGSSWLTQSGGNSAGNSSKPTVTATSTKTSALPKTGEDAGIIASAAGGALLLASGIIAGILRRKKR
jgi:LPXTG-motif cell wall-anchored protein/uncharacterized repeat protein (TIGR02543 family)